MALTMRRKVLILFAHPSLQRSEVNIRLYRASRELDDITLVDLYHDYPTYHIDIDREQKRLLAHDVLVFMFPLYWYSTPALLKEWQDLVLEYGFAYGEDATALKDKLFLCALTAGGGEGAYRADGYNHYTIRELLRPLEQTAAICGMQFLAPFALFGSRTAVEDQRLDSHIDNWKRLLLAIRDDRLDLGIASQLHNLDDDLHSIIKAPE